MIGQRKSLRIIGGTDIPQPTFEATDAERATLRRFLDFALADLKFQWQEMQKALPFDRAELEHHQTMAIAFSKYVNALGEGLDKITVAVPVPVPGRDKAHSPDGDADEGGLVARVRAAMLATGLDVVDWQESCVDDLARAAIGALKPMSRAMIDELKDWMESPFNIEGGWSEDFLQAGWSLVIDAALGYPDEETH